MCWWQAGATSTCWCALEGPEVLLNSDGGVSLASAPAHRFALSL